VPKIQKPDVPRRYVSDVYVGLYVLSGGRTGRIARVSKDRGNFWTEAGTMFSIRADGNYRAFPGKASAEPARIMDKIALKKYQLRLEAERATVNS